MLIVALISSMLCTSVAKQLRSFHTPSIFAFLYSLYLLFYVHVICLFLPAPPPHIPIGNLYYFLIDLYQLFILCKNNQPNHHFPQFALNLFGIQAFLIFCIIIIKTLCLCICAFFPLLQSYKLLLYSGVRLCVQLNVFLDLVSLEAIWKLSGVWCWH